MSETADTLSDSSSIPAADGEGSSRIWLGGLLFGLAACVYYLVVEIYLLSGQIGFPLDDSWIHLQFARNLVTGQGLSFNPGELVPGSTAPVWTALLSLIFVLPGNPIFWTKLFGIALYLLGGALTYRLAVEMGVGRGLANLAAVVTLATSWLVWSALSGLEIPLFVVLSLAGIVLHIRERREPDRLPLSLPVLAVAFLARPEAGLMVLAAVVDRVLVWERGNDSRLVWRRPRWRPLMVGLLLAAVIVAPVMLFNLAVTGSILPTTFGAKSGGVGRWLPEMGYLYTVLGIFFQAQPWMTLLAGGGAVLLVSRVGTAEDTGLLPVLWLFGLPMAYGLIDQPGPTSLVGNFGRYYFPLFPVVIVLGTVALRPLARRLEEMAVAETARSTVRILLLLVLLLPSLAELLQGAGRYAQTVANVQDSDVRVALWLADRLPPEAVLGVGDIGAIKYLLPNRVADLAGIVSPEIKQWGAAEFLQHHQPDYLVIFPHWLSRLFEDVSAFPVVREFPIENNITMAGDVLVLYATPWTRFPLHEPPGGSTP